MPASLSILPDSPELAFNCLNLRPESVFGVNRLVPTLPPAIMASRRWRVIGIFNGRGDEVVELMVDGATLGASVHAQSARPSEPYIITNSLEGEATCAYRVADGFIVLTDKHMHHIVYDDSGVLRAEVPVSPSDYPTLVSSITSETTLQATVGGFNLSGVYTPDRATLDPDDAVKLDKAVRDAYSRASADALADGGFVAPVFVRYRMFDSDGKLLFVSTPKLHVPTGRHDYRATHSLTVDMDDRHVNTGSFPLSLYRLSLHLPASDGSAAQRQIARIEVQVTPQIHRVLISENVVNRLSHGVSGSSLTYLLPGCSDLSGGADSVNRRLRKYIERFDAIFSTVVTIDNPFEGSKEARTVAIPGLQMLVHNEGPALRRKVSTEPVWMSRCRPPHSVTAAVGAAQGDVTLLANLNVRLYDGAPVFHFVNSGTVADTVETVATVRFGDQRRAVTTATWHQGYRQAALSPVIIYPDPEATSITFTVRDSDGNVSSASFGLSRYGNYACYFDPDAKPITLTPCSGPLEVPASQNMTVNYPGHVVNMSDGGDLQGIEAGYGCINAIVPVSQPSSSAWESSRARFHLMGDDGIMNLAIADGKLTPPVVLDPRRVDSPGAVATATGSTGRVYAIAGRDLVAIKGNKVGTVACNIDARMLVWIARHDELLVIPTPSDNLSNVLVYRPDAGGWSTRLLPPLSAVYSHPTLPRATSDTEDALYDLSADIGSPVRCRYTAPVPLEARHQMRDLPFLSEIVLDLTAGDVSGTLSIDCHNGHRPGVTLATAVINGSLERPLAHRLFLPPRLYIEATLDAMLSPDAVLGPYSYTLTDSKRPPL